MPGQLAMQPLQAEGGDYDPIARAAGDAVHQQHRGVVPDGLPARVGAGSRRGTNAAEDPGAHLRIRPAVHRAEQLAAGVCHRDVDEPGILPRELSESRLAVGRVHLVEVGDEREGLDGVAGVGDQRRLLCRDQPDEVAGPQLGAADEMLSLGI